jgi:hypothetical protein
MIFFADFACPVAPEDGIGAALREKKTIKV